MVPVYMPDVSIYLHVPFIGRAFTLFKHRPDTGRYGLWPMCIVVILDVFARFARNHVRERSFMQSVCHNRLNLRTTNQELIAGKRCLCVSRFQKNVCVAIGVSLHVFACSAGK